MNFSGSIGKQESTEQVVSRLQAATLDLLCQPRMKLAQTRVSLFSLLRRHGTARDCDGRIRPTTKVIQAVVPNPEHFGNDAHWYRHGQFGDEFTMVSALQRIDRFVGKGESALAEARDHARRKRAVHNTAVALVGFAVHGLHGEVRLKRMPGTLGFRGEARRIARNFAQIFVAGDQPPLVFFIPMDRILTPQVGQRGISGCAIVGWCHDVITLVHNDRLYWHDWTRKGTAARPGGSQGEGGRSLFPAAVCGGTSFPGGRCGSGVRNLLSRGDGPLVDT